MTEQDVISFLKELNFDVEAKLDFGICTILVSKDDFERLSDVDLNERFGFDVSFLIRKKFKLIPASVGDFVLIGNSYFEHDDIGIVSSKIGDLYGCRYIVFDRISSSYDIKITSENYNGYHRGFLKVLTKEEAIAHLLDASERYIAEKLSEIKSMEEKFKRNIPLVVDELTKLKVEKVERAFLTSDNNIIGRINYEKDFEEIHD